MTPVSHQDLAAAIRREAILPGGLSFRRFMTLALYHPEWGYYSSGQATTGRGGDFFTSVSVGPMFGRLLAARLAAWWRDAGCPRRWHLLEQGANDGQLMSDVLDALPGPMRTGVRPAIIEPAPILRARQAARLGHGPVPIDWRASLPPDVPPDGPVAYLANELLDAFPVEKIIRVHEQWMSLNVVVRGDGFGWEPAPLPDDCRPWVPDEGLPWPDGYTTEICPELEAWAADLARAVPVGMVLLADYGFEAADYFHPTRRDGTLRGYHRHHALDDPFQAIGLTDLTAHVNWSHATRALENHGFQVCPPVDQGRWLTRAATPWLIEQEASPEPGLPKFLRQFQTLTHPQHLGGKFQILEATR